MPGPSSLAGVILMWYWVVPGGLSQVRVVPNLFRSVLCGGVSRVGGVTLATALKASTSPAPAHAAPASGLSLGSLPNDLAVPFNWALISAGVRSGFWDSMSPAIPETIGA